MAPRTEAAARRSAEHDLIMTRIFDAPRRLVFKAWAEPERMAQWWGPKGFTLPVCEMDVRAGGAYRFTMRSPEGNEFRTQGVFREVVEPERLVFTGGWVDEHGKPTGPEMITTVTFEDHQGKTRLTLHSATFESVAARNEHRGGWSSSLERLAEYLAAA